MNNLTELVFILDKSGSMCGMEKDVIGGFNSMIKRQREESESALVSTFLFSDGTEMLHDRVDLDKIRPMTEKEYVTDGCTALYDAIGKAVDHIGKIHKYAREEDRPARTIFIITTDGMENASKFFYGTTSKKFNQSPKKEIRVGISVRCRRPGFQAVGGGNRNRQRPRRSILRRHRHPCNV